MYELLIFDLDGTISDPLEGSTNCTNHALVRHGLPEVDATAVAELIGPPLNEAFEAIVGADSRELIDRLVATYRERQGGVGLLECRLYPGVVDALSALAGYGRRLAVCTSKPTRFATQILAHYGIAHWFDFIDGGDVRIPKWQQLRRLRDEGRVPADAIMIGDRGVDLAAGHRNGLDSAGVLWGYGSRAELESEAPRHLFGSPSEWLDLAAAR